MDESPAVKTSRIHRWLPYCAVFQADLNQTLRSWVFRSWLLLSVIATAGFLFWYIALRYGMRYVQSASEPVSQVLYWGVLAAITVTIVLTGGSISSERGTMADSILSRGISRYQYFLGKLHARLAAVLGCFLTIGLIAIVGGKFWLHSDLSFIGCLLTLLSLLALLTAVASCGVAVSAIADSTMLGIAILWFALFGAGFLMSLLPEKYPSPHRLLNDLPNILRGVYDSRFHLRLIGWSLACSVLSALIGLGYFARRDV